MNEDLKPIYDFEADWTRCNSGNNNLIIFENKNLERCTKSENMRHAYKKGLCKPHASYGMLGKKNPNAGIKKRAVRIIETGQVFESQSACERYLFGENSKSHINDCLRGRQKSVGGYHFEYV